MTPYPPEAYDEHGCVRFVIDGAVMPWAPAAIRAKVQLANSAPPERPQPPVARKYPQPRPTQSSAPQVARNGILRDKPIRKAHKSASERIAAQTAEAQNLVFGEGTPIAEVAALHGISVKTVYQRLRDACTPAPRNRKPAPIGQKFQKLKVLREVRVEHKHRMMECLCDCGKTTVASWSFLKAGKRQSCGCMAKKALRSSPEVEAAVYARWKELGEVTATAREFGRPRGWVYRIIERRKDA